MAQADLGGRCLIEQSRAAEWGSRASSASDEKAASGAMREQAQ